MLAVEEIGGAFVGVCACPGEQAVVRGQCASGVRARGVAGQREGLAATAAPIDLTPLTGAAGLRHPTGPAKPLERRRAVPDFGEARFVDRRELKPGQGLRRMAGQYLARRRHVQEAPAPAPHARLRPMRVIVGYYVIDYESPDEACAGGLDGRGGGVELFA